MLFLVCLLLFLMSYNNNIINILVILLARPLYVGCTIVPTNRQEQLLHFTSLLITTLQSTAGLPVYHCPPTQEQWSTGTENCYQQIDNIKSFHVISQLYSNTTSSNWEAAAEEYWSSRVWRRRRRDKTKFHLLQLASIN